MFYHYKFIVNSMTMISLVFIESYLVYKKNTNKELPPKSMKNTTKIIHFLIYHCFLFFMFWLKFGW